MSGHSKWHNIQAHKGKQDKMRSNAFTKVARYITVAAREGGGDQLMNFSLRLAVEKAKAINMPRDNIERSIKKGTGELNDGTTLEEIVYEGFGPGGVAVIIETMTDNKNRTVGEIKNLISKHGGSLAGPGSVRWQFSRLGVVRIDSSRLSVISNQQSDFELTLIDAGAEDIIKSDFGIEVRCLVSRFQKVVEIVKSFGVELAESGIEWVAKENIDLDEDQGRKMVELYEALEENDDVKAVYTNEG